MTVKELIAELSKHDLNLPVVVNAARSELANGQDCEAVAVIDQNQWRDCETWHVEYYPHLPPDDGDKRRVAVNVTA